MRQKIFFILFIIIFTINSKADFKIEAVDTINIPISNDIDYWFRYSVMISDNQEGVYFYALSLDKKRIFLFDITKKKYLQTYLFDDKYNGFYVKNHNNTVNEDSGDVILINDNNLVFYDITSQKIIKKRLVLNNDDFSSYFGLSLNNTENLFFVNENLFFGISARVVPPEYYKYPKLLKISIDNVKIDTNNFLVWFPICIQKENKNYNLYNANYTTDTTTIFVSYQMLDSIYKFSLDGKFQKSSNCKSVYIDNILPLDSTINDYSNHNVRNSFYSSIYYDQYRKLLYRVVLHKYIKNTSDNIIDEFYAKKWSLQIITKDLEVIKEIEFPSNIYRFSQIYITKEGLLISNNNENNTNFSPDILSFTLFRVSYE